MGVNLKLTVRPAEDLAVEATVDLIRRLSNVAVEPELDAETYGFDVELLSVLRAIDAEPDRLARHVRERLGALLDLDDLDRGRGWLEFEPAGRAPFGVEHQPGRDEEADAPVTFSQRFRALADGPGEWLFGRLVEASGAGIDHVLAWTDDGDESPGHCIAIHHRRLSDFVLDLARIGVGDPSEPDPWSAEFRAAAERRGPGTLGVHRGIQASYDRIIRRTLHEFLADGAFLRPLWLPYQVAPREPPPAFRSEERRLRDQQAFTHRLLRRPELAVIDLGPGPLRELLVAVSGDADDVTFTPDGRGGGRLRATSGTLQPFDRSLHARLDRANPVHEPRPGDGTYPHPWTPAILERPTTITGGPLAARPRMQRETIRVGFEDEETGRGFAGTRLALADLDALLPIHRSIEIDGTWWTVTAVRPTTRSMLRVHRCISVQLLRRDRPEGEPPFFLHPSHAGSHPTTRDPDPGRTPCVLVPCEGRQEELVARALRPSATRLCERIDAVRIAAHDDPDHRCRSCIDRSELGSPRAGASITLDALQEALPPRRRWPGLALLGPTGPWVDGGFAIETEHGSVLYGVERGGVVEILGRGPVPLIFEDESDEVLDRYDGEVLDMAERFGLDLDQWDWAGRRAIDPARD